MRRTKNKIPKINIRKGDNVMVISGNDRGKTGRVLDVLVKERRAYIEGINIRTKHTKPSAQNPDGGIQKMEMPIQISNVMLMDPKSGDPTRVGRKLNKKGKLVRYSKKSGEEID